MISLGFHRGKASPCCYYRPSRDLRCVVHGDDFILAGLPRELGWARRAVSDSFLTKEVGTLGDGAGEVPELRILNRVVRWCSDGLRYEADPRHVDILLKGIAGTARALSTPGTQSRDLNPDDDEELSEVDAGLYRSFAARANYLSLDRPDLAFPAKELCRRMRSPGKTDLEALRRLGRYLLDSPPRGLRLPMGIYRGPASRVRGHGLRGMPTNAPQYLGRMRVVGREAGKALVIDPKGDYAQQRGSRTRRRGQGCE